MEQVLGRDRSWMTRDEFIRYIEQAFPNTRDRIVAFKIVGRDYSVVAGREIATHEETSVGWPKKNMHPEPEWNDVPAEEVRGIMGKYIPCDIA